MEENICKCGHLEKDYLKSELTETLLHDQKTNTTTKILYPENNFVYPYNRCDCNKFIEK